MTLRSLLLIAAFAGCTTTKPKPVALGPNSIPQKSVTLTARDRGTYVALQPKGTLTVSLESNSSAGYHWKLAQPLDSAVLQLASASGNQLPPVALAPEGLTKPQLEQWVFKGAGPGTQKVRLIYQRPDQPLAEAVTYDFTVNVE
ncbi:MAG: protease inhibitor I42 family protein [Chthoniobacteraceae bacterium]